MSSMFISTIVIFKNYFTIFEQVDTVYKQELLVILPNANLCTLWCVLTFSVCWTIHEYYLLVLVLKFDYVQVYNDLLTNLVSIEYVDDKAPNIFFHIQYWSFLYLLTNIKLDNIWFLINLVLTTSIRCQLYP